MVGTVPCCLCFVEAVVTQAARARCLMSRPMARWRNDCDALGREMEVIMKKVVLLFFLILVVMLWADEKSHVTVKSAEKSNGVVIVTLVENGKTIELQCNENQGFCAAPKTGTYSMLRLPKNRGVYDCQNVDLFSGPDSEQKIGEYCLVEK